MKLKKYQINAIVEEAFNRIEKVRTKKAKSIKLNAEDKSIIGLKDEYDKLFAQKEEIQNSLDSLDKTFKEKIDNRFFGLYHDKKSIKEAVYKHAVDRKYGKVLTKEDIERKLVISDLGSDFNIEDFIEDLLDIYKK